MCNCYLAAPGLLAEGVHTVSTDEMTGIQALERIAPTKPLQPGRPEVQPTRTENDFAEHLEQTVATDPEAGWIFVCDNLTTHCSESLVRWVAERCGIEEDLGKKGKCGVLKSVATRKAFLKDLSHRLRFLYVPKHTSWLNQIEIWFSILVRRVIKRGNFTSAKDLRDKILAFIDYFNRTMSKPFKWTFTGRPLNV